MKRESSVILLPCLNLIWTKRRSSICQNSTYATTSVEYCDKEERLCLKYKKQVSLPPHYLIFHLQEGSKTIQSGPVLIVYVKLVIDLEG